MSADPNDLAQRIATYLTSESSDRLTDDDLRALIAVSDQATTGRWRLMNSSRYGQADATEVDAGPYTWSVRTVVGFGPNPADPVWMVAAQPTIGRELARETLAWRDAADRIRAEHVRIEDGVNEGFCSGDESVWEHCPTLAALDAADAAIRNADATTP